MSFFIVNFMSFTLDVFKVNTNYKVQIMSLINRTFQTLYFIIISLEKKCKQHELFCDKDYVFIYILTEQLLLRCHESLVISM